MNLRGGVRSTAREHQNDFLFIYITLLVFCSCFVFSFVYVEGETCQTTAVVCQVSVKYQTTEIAEAT
jgi:hypothetical protein